MKKVFLILTILLTAASLQAQQVFFIEIDAENKQPFLVTLGSKVFNSTSTGHLIIPDLVDSTYQLVINFPDKFYPEQIFSVSINKKDKGLLLKKESEKNWELFDWQTSKAIKSRDALSKLPEGEESNLENSKNAFAIMMASVVNDTAVLFTTSRVEKIASGSGKKAETPGAVVKVKQAEVAISTREPDSKDTLLHKTTNSQTDSLVSTNIQETGMNANKTIIQKQPQGSNTKLIGIAVVDQNRTDPAKDSSNIKKSEVDSSMKTEIPAEERPLEKDSFVEKNKTKRSIIIPMGERWTNDSREFLYADSSAGSKTDTIKVIIVLDKLTSTAKASFSDSNYNEVKSVAAEGDSLKVKVVPPVPLGTITKSDTILVKEQVVNRMDSAKEKKDPAFAKKTQIINSDCKNFASESDVDKLRIKMLAESNLDERVLLAKKIFRTKCFTTRQVKALTELFMSDKARYNFFDTAYPFVSDSENFKGLVEMLTEEYYISRFKVMVRM